MSASSTQLFFMMSNTILVRNLTKIFGKGEQRTYALHDVSLEIRAGRITTLIGPSGSGKSTLLAVVSGLLRPDEGTVCLLGEDIWTLTDREREEFRRLHCGFIFQQCNLFPALNACQQLEIALRWASEMPAASARDRARDTLITLGLDRQLHLRPQQLSGGEKQRVAVARALVKHPQLIFADEPTASLDWGHGEQVVRMLRTASKEQNATVLLVSHDPRIIPLSDILIRIEDGRIFTDQ